MKVKYKKNYICQLFEKEIELPGVPCEWFNRRKIDKSFGISMFKMLKNPRSIKIK